MFQWFYIECEFLFSRINLFVFVWFKIFFVRRILNTWRVDSVAILLEILALILWAVGTKVWFRYGWCRTNNGVKYYFHGNKDFFDIEMCNDNVHYNIPLKTSYIQRSLTFSKRRDFYIGKIVLFLNLYGLLFFKNF